MELSGGGSHMIMQSFEPNGEMYGFQQANSINTSTQGLSLSLYNPMNITHDHQENLFMDDGSGRLNFFQSSLHQPQHHQQIHQDFVLKRSKYLIPAQELLNEFCHLENESLKKENQGISRWTHEGGSSSSSLYSLDLVELHSRKAKLQSMLEEVHRRYRRYCEQMRSVVSGFEAIAGENSANAYSILASKAMSRHFRCLKDGIVSQLEATKNALGEREGNRNSNAVAPGTTKGETPRLKKLDQCLRQQKAFHQTGIMDSQPWRPQRGLPERSVSVLRAWLFEHFLHPYPSDVDKHILARQTGLSRSQVSNWFINARVRLWKPMVEDMYMEELKEEGNLNSNPSSSEIHLEDQKPAVPGFHINNDSDSLSSIINTRNPINTNNYNPNAGVVELDFSSYNASNDVSLTLGLQQQEQSLLFSREDNERGVQFSILDDEGQNLMPQRNFMGAQMMHDLI